MWIGLGTFASFRAEGGLDYLLLSKQMPAITAAQKAGTDLTPEQKKIEQQWQALITKHALPSTSGENARAAEWRDRGYIGYVKDRGTGFVRHLGDFESGYFFADILGAMLVGMALFKSGFLSAELPLSTYIWTAFGGFLISTPLYIAGVWKAYSSHFYFAVVNKWMVSTYHLTAEAGTLAIAAFLLIVIKSDAMRILLRPFAAIGQTALTNYLLTSFLCQFLFIFGPPKFYGQLEYYQLLYVVLAVWVVNLVVSSVWIRAFEFGPCEWLWRSLTYWKLQPMLFHR